MQRIDGTENGLQKDEPQTNGGNFAAVVYCQANRMKMDGKEDVQTQLRVWR